MLKITRLLKAFGPNEPDERSEQYTSQTMLKSALGRWRQL